MNGAAARESGARQADAIITRASRYFQGKEMWDITPTHVANVIDMVLTGEID